MNHHGLRQLELLLGSINVHSLHATVPFLLLSILKHFNAWGQPFNLQHSYISGDPVSRPVAGVLDAESAVLGV
jgi:hypothetical protein